MKNTIIHIGARSNSKGLKNKNTISLFGKPLIKWSIDFAKKINPKIGIIVNTDSQKIINIAKKSGVKFILKRPRYLSGPTASKFSAWQFACRYLYEKKIIDKNDLFLDLDCTCPMRKKKDIKDLIKKFFYYKSKKKNFDCLFTVTKARRNPYFNILEKKNDYFYLSKKIKKDVIRRQDAPEVFEHCGVGYALKPEFLLNQNNFLNGKLLGHEIEFENSLDIDSDFDLKIAKSLLKNGR